MKKETDREKARRYLRDAMHEEVDSRFLEIDVENVPIEFAELLDENIEHILA